MYSTTPSLIARMRPIINDSLSQVGAVRAYDDMMGPYKRMPLVPDVKADLTDYAVEKALDGLFFKLAEEEAAIRRNPASCARRSSRPVHPRGSTESARDSTSRWIRVDTVRSAFRCSWARALTLFWAIGRSPSAPPRSSRPPGCSRP